jgi:hypothetical protein
MISPMSTERPDAAVQTLPSVALVCGQEPHVREDDRKADASQHDLDFHSVWCDERE